jgi:dephospho-CoA kinase
VVGFAGPIGAGKTTGAMHLVRSHGFEYVRYSQVLAEWAGNDAGSKSALQATGWRVMSGGLQDQLNEKVLARINPEKDTAVDGLRHLADEAALRRRYAANFCLFYISAPEESRWHRTFATGRFRSLEQFKLADEHDVEQPLRGLRALADGVIDNSGSMDDYLGAIDVVLKAIRQRKERS